MCVGLCDGRMYAWGILSHAESREQLDAPRNCSIRSYNSRCENKLHVWQHLHNQTCRDSGKNYNMTSSELLRRSQIKPGFGRGRLTAVLLGGGGGEQVHCRWKDTMHHVLVMGLEYLIGGTHNKTSLTSFYSKIFMHQIWMLRHQMAILLSYRSKL